MQLKVTFLFGMCGTFSRVSADHLARRRQHHQGADETFQCNVKLIHGMVHPGQVEVSAKYICHDVEEPGYTYRLSGEVGSFFEGEDMASGNVEVNVPYSAVDSDGNIPIDGNEASPITVSYDRRRLSSVSSTGTKKVLVVRVSDDENGANGGRRVDQDELQLFWDVFGDENNLKKVYKRCSGNKLKFVPATGERVNRGVITVDPPPNFCGLYFESVSNYASAQLAGLNIDAEHFMFIMPDCLDWFDAMAWGELNGYLTWIPTTYASFPMMQVHELGHNLGLGHSGSDGSDDYGDETCYMGNKVPWDDTGAKMCFNASKLWYLGWYSKYHGSYKPEKYGVSARLIGIGEAQVREGLIDNEKVVIKLISNRSKTHHLFLTYNHRKGPNEGVVGDWNRVVITQQKKRSSNSYKKRALAPGGIYYKRNWDSHGNTLVVKHCGFTRGSWGNSPKLASANIIIYVQGRSSKSCSAFGNALVSSDINASNGHLIGLSNQGSNIDHVRSRGSMHYDSTSGTGSCIDFPGFSDSYGTDYNCEWYEQEEYLCTSSGSDVPNSSGHTAVDACCVCGGGQYSDAPDPVTMLSPNTIGDSTDWYNEWSITP